VSCSDCLGGGPHSDRPGLPSCACACHLTAKLKRAEREVQALKDENRQLALDLKTALNRLAKAEGRRVEEGPLFKEDDWRRSDRALQDEGRTTPSRAVCHVCDEDSKCPEHR